MVNQQQDLKTLFVSPDDRLFAMLYVAFHQGPFLPAANVSQAMKLLSQIQFDLIVLDDQLADDHINVLLPVINALEHQPAVVVLSEPDTASLQRAYGFGAMAIETKPVRPERLEQVTRLIGCKSLRHRSKGVPLGSTATFVAESQYMRTLYELLLLAFRLRVSVLLFGPAGCGKKTLCHYIHERLASPSDCTETSLQEALELAPAERNAANTIIIDLDNEKADFASSLRTVEAARRWQAPFVVCTSDNGKLGTAAEIMQVTLRLPSLSERPEDIDPIIQLYSRLYSSRHGTAEPAIVAAATELHKSDTVTELQRVIEQLVLGQATGSRRADSLLRAVAEKWTLKQLEAEYLRCLAAEGFGQDEIASILKVHRSTLYRKRTKTKLKP